MDIRSVLIGILLVAVGALGFYVYQQNQNTIQIQLPSVKVNPS